MMRFRMFGIGVASLLLTVAASALQAPAQAAVPTGATGKCTDGSYTTAAKKWQACGGHKGVQSWFADGAAKPASMSPQTSASAAQATAAPATAAPAPAPAASTPAAAPAAKTKASAARAAGTPRAVAPGGGPGLVWVNTDSKIYHCPGTADYGTTKVGKYMSEADAKSAGARPNRNVACSK